MVVKIAKHQHKITNTILYTTFGSELNSKVLNYELMKSMSIDMSFPIGQHISDIPTHKRRVERMKLQKLA